LTILVATDFSAREWTDWWPALRAALPGETLLREVSDPSAIDIALVANPPAGLLGTLPKLRLIQALWAGVDRLLADATLPRGVPLARMVDPAMSQAIAETALWAVLSLHREYLDYAAQQRRGEWRQRPQRRADEVTVAVLGLGEMGRAAALRLAGNGYRVVGWSTRPVELAGVACRSGSAQLAAVLGEAEVVVNLLPLTAATRGLFDRRTLQSMRRGASLVNLGRGGHVVEADLLEALDSGLLRHAVLDVFGTEPLPSGHAFWAHPKVTLLPHIAALTDPRSAASVVARNVRALRSGAPLAHVVDHTRGY
jgi:glyoxylate/hydroxypyruvate reductase A